MEPEIRRLVTQPTKGVGTVQKLLELTPKTRVIMLSGHVDCGYLRRALDSGG